VNVACPFVSIVTPVPTVIPFADVANLNPDAPPLGIS